MRRCPNLPCSVRGTKRNTTNSNSSDSDNISPMVPPSTTRPTLLPLPIPEQRRTLRKRAHAAGPSSQKSSLQVLRKQNGSALSICSLTRPSWRGGRTASSKISKSVSVPRPFFAFSSLSFFFTSSKPPTFPPTTFIFIFGLVLTVIPPFSVGVHTPFIPLRTFGIQY